MPRFFPGGIYVRTVPTPNPATPKIHGQESGDIVMAENGSNSTYCYYYKNLNSQNFRDATPEEMDLFLNTGEMSTKSLQYKYWETQLGKNFIVGIHKDVKRMAEYKNLCQLHGIPYEKIWNGTGDYYGVIDNKAIVSSYKNKIATHHYFDEFIQLLNNPIKQKENGTDVSTENLEDRRSKIKGTAFVSGTAKPNAATSRLVGNKISSLIRPTGARKSTIRFGVRHSFDS